MAKNMFMRNGQWVSTDVARKLRQKELAADKELKAIKEENEQIDEEIAEAAKEERAEAGHPVFPPSKTRGPKGAPRVGDKPVKPRASKKAAKKASK